MISLFGTLAFRELPGAAPLPRPLHHLVLASVLIALVTGCLWFVLTAQTLAETESLSESMRMLVPVAWDTQFGNWLLVRLALLIAVLVLSRNRVTLLIVVVALGSQPELAHAGAVGGRLGFVLTVSEALHMLAAGAWLGGLMPLALSLVLLPPVQAAALCHRFSAVALGAVLILMATGLVQASGFLGRLSALVNTQYGLVLSLKLLLVLCAVGLGALNRFVLIRTVASSAITRSRMRRSLAAEATFGLAIVLAAATLANLSPGNGDSGMARSVPLLVPAAATADRHWVVAEESDGARTVCLVPIADGRDLAVATGAMIPGVAAAVDRAIRGAGRGARAAGGNG
jgi:putative copper resistance protein D